MIRNVIESNWSRSHYQLNLDNPKAIAEKLEWLKLNHQDVLLFEIVDKIAVRNYVSRTIGNSSLLVEIFALYDNVKDIDTNKLPEIFVLKPSHWSGNVIHHISRQSAKTSRHIDFFRLSASPILRSDVFCGMAILVPPKLIAEKYLED